MRNQLITFLAIMFFTFLGAFAQDPESNNFNSYFTDSYANIVPQTPNAANFMQYGNTPVNASSGLPSISIPLFTLEEDGVQVPITLTYNASGIKVDDVSSTVGLKWTLNAGGMISRTINDLDDFKDGKGWVFGGSTSHFDNWWATNPNYDFSMSSNRNIFQTFLSSTDIQPDNFNYNFLNYSGSFVFTTNFDMLFGDLSNKIQEGNTSRDAIELIDLYGNNFQFQTFLERNRADTYFYTEGENTFNHNREENIVSWMLESVNTKNGETIHFNYDEYTYYDENFYSQRLVTAFGYECGVEFPYGSEFEGSVHFRNDKLKSTRIKNNTKNQLIRHIYTDNVEVEFVYVDGPVDGIAIEGWDKRIDRILIKDKIQNKHKEFHFKYGTFNGQGVKKRLKLLEVQEKGYNTLLKPPYVFEYDESHLPKVGSFAKDYKGYYNGKNNNQTLFPKTKTTLNRTDTYYFPNEPPFILRPGYNLLSDRYFDEYYLKSGILKAINYPTGGRSEFTYEANAIGVNTQEPLIKGYSFSFSNDFNEYTGTYANPNEYAYGYLFELKNFVGLMELNINGNSDCPDCSCLCPEVPKIDIYEYFPDQDINEEIIYDSAHIGERIARKSFTGGSPYFEFDPSPNTNVYIVMLKLGGTGTTYIPPPASNAHHVYVNLKWNQEEVDQNNNTIFQQHYFGGLRIKEVKDIDESDKTYNLTKYKYLEGFDPNPFDSSKCVQFLGGQYIFTPEPQWLPGTQVSNGYYYSHVEIEKTNRNIYGKTEEFYLPKYNFFSLSSGELFKKKVYDKDQSLVQLDFIDFSTSQPYEYKLQYHIPSAQDRLYNRIHYCEIFPDNPFQHNWPVASFDNHVYGQHYFGGWRLPSTSRSTQFLDNGNGLEPVTTVTTFEYTDELQLEKETIDTRYTAQVSGEEITGYVLDNSNGEVITIDYQYVSEFKPTIPWSVPDGLTISKEVKNGITKVVGEFYEYDTAGNIKNTYRYNKGVGSHNGPNYVPSDYKLEVSYLIDEGKPTQIQAKDGVFTSYIWGYGKQYPIAKIENASNQAIASALNISVATLLTYDETNLAALNNLRALLPNTQVVTYTYSPMVGVTSITDPKGYTMTYKYDDFGRLQYVKDMDDNILSENQYHYIND